MSLPTGSVLGIFSDNLSKRGSVLPLSKNAVTSWAESLNIPRGGETILYTGHMYQLMPYISVLADQMAMFENSLITRFFPIGRLVNKFINLTFFMGIGVSSDDRNDSVQPLRTIARLLQKAGVSFGYLYEDELYSGALAYDAGLDDVFRLHAQRVSAIFKKNNVRRVITVDPHTTNILREVYPRFVDDFDLEVISYLDVLVDSNLQPIRQVDDEVVIHDSCVYSRYEGMIDPPRRLLSLGGITVKEPEQWGLETHCCGGPMESLFPADAHKVASTRMEQLNGAGGKVVAMCPICLVNLGKAVKKDMDVCDITSVMANVYLQSKMEQNVKTLRVGKSPHSRHT